MLKNFIGSTVYSICGIVICLILMISSFSYEGYKFYILFGVCFIVIVLILKNMYKRGVFHERKYRR